MTGETWGDHAKGGANATGRRSHRSASRVEGFRILPTPQSYSSSCFDAGCRSQAWVWDGLAIRKREAERLGGSDGEQPGGGTMISLCCTTAKPFTVVGQARPRRPY